MAIENNFLVFLSGSSPKCATTANKRGWEFLGTWTKARGSLPMPELWAKKYPGFSHYLIKSRSRVRSRSYCSSSKKRHKKCPGLLSDDQSYICISVSSVIDFLLWGITITPYDLYLIFEKSNLDELDFFVYFGLDFCRLQQGQ